MNSEGGRRKAEGGTRDPNSEFRTPNSAFLLRPPSTVHRPPREFPCPGPWLPSSARCCKTRGRVSRPRVAQMPRREGRHEPAAALGRGVRRGLQGDRRGRKAALRHPRLHHRIARTPRALRPDQRLSEGPQARLPGRFRVPRQQHPLGRRRQVVSADPHGLGPGRDAVPLGPRPARWKATARPWPRAPALDRPGAGAGRRANRPRRPPARQRDGHATAARSKLVDYDGMCVPALVGRRNLEVGVEPYQHPQRNESTRLSPAWTTIHIFLKMRTTGAHHKAMHAFLRPEQS